MKYLIINADDFGISSIFNDIILDLIIKNKVCSVTVMVNLFTGNQKSQFEKLISLSKKKNLSIGLHLEFKTKDYLSQIRFQFQKFKSLFGFNPSHLDIHKAHGLKDSFPYVAEFCKEKGIPLRNNGVLFNDVKSTPSEAFFGSISNFSRIEDWIKTFKDGIYYEILFHPGKFDPECKSSLNKNRERDMQHIIKLNSILERKNIKLASYLDLAAVP